MIRVDFLVFVDSTISPPLPELVKSCHVFEFVREWHSWMIARDGDPIEQ